MSKVDENLKKNGVVDVKFYYKSLPLVGNVFTVCALLSEDKKLLARGVSICSVLDSHSKKYARKMSKDRALAAYFNKQSSLAIGHDEKLNSEIEKRLIKGEFRKSFSFKTPEAKAEIEQAALDLGFQTKVYPHEVAVFVPYFFPVDVTKSNFSYKSEFNPKPTDEEVKILRLS